MMRNMQYQSGVPCATPTALYVYLRLLHESKFIRCRLVPEILVGMQLEGQLAVRLFDDGRLCCPLDPQNIVMATHSCLACGSHASFLL